MTKLDPRVLLVEEAAFSYMALGLSVIALRGKQPNGLVHRHGLTDALDKTSDVGDVQRAFRHQMTTGVGVLVPRWAIVVDIDGEVGAAAWKDIAGEDYMPLSWIAKTGRGLHLWFGLPDAVSPEFEGYPSGKLSEKLDLKGVGGYVAAPPSLHPDGHIYEWLMSPWEETLIEVPPALEKVMKERRFELERKLVAKAANQKVRHKQFEDGKWWATWGFDHLISLVANAEEGNRNGLLHWAAATMAEEGADAEEYEKLGEAALLVGLMARETRLTIRSGQRKGEKRAT